MAAPSPLKNQMKLWSRVLHANVGIVLAITLGLIALSCPFIAFGGGGTVGDVLKAIHYGEFLPPNQRWIWINGQGLGLLFLVVSGWLIHHKTIKRAASEAADDPRAPGSSVTILFDPAHGGARRHATALAANLEEAGMRAFQSPLDRYDLGRLAQERWMIFFIGDSAPTIVLGEEPKRLLRLEYLVLESTNDLPQPATELGSLGEIKRRGARFFPPMEPGTPWIAHVRNHLAARTAAVKPPVAQAPARHGREVGQPSGTAGR